MGGLPEVYDADIGGCGNDCSDSGGRGRGTGDKPVEEIRLSGAAGAGEGKQKGTA